MKPRARDLGIPFEGTPGPLNAITDVAGVEVGHVTLISGHGTLVVGKGPIRTGVTAILPRGLGDSCCNPCPAAAWSLNASGEMTGAAWIEEGGLLTGPVMLSNTMAIGAVHEGVLRWGLKRFPNSTVPGLPVVGEAHDGDLHDMRGLHVRPEHAIQAIEAARGGPVAEGNVGAGVGMAAHGFKSGIGTASRVVHPCRGGGYTVAALVMANNGGRGELRIAGTPVGQEIRDYMPTFEKNEEEEGRSSIVVVIATDAPLLPHQLKRVARRIPMGLARNGAFAHNRSGDLFVVFSTAQVKLDEDGHETWRVLPNERMSPLFEATAQAVEEAVVNALVAAEDLTGQNGHTYYAIPHDRLQEVLAKYGRLQVGAAL